MRNTFSKLRIDHVNNKYQLNDTDITLAKDYKIRGDLTPNGTIYMVTLTIPVEDLEIINNPKNVERKLKFKKD